jgi:uncharacterized protein YxjI
MKFFVRDRLFDMGEDYWIEDEDGRKVFLVDGKVLRLRDTFQLKDTDRRVLLEIKKKFFAVRDTMNIERDDERLATVRRKHVTLLRNHYHVEVADGSELEVSGDILDHEFVIEQDDRAIAVVSRKRLQVRETYAVDIVHDDADQPLLLAVAVAAIHLAEEHAKEHGEEEEVRSED